MSLSVVNAPTEWPISLAGVKAHLRIEHSEDDSMLEAMIEAACVKAQHTLQRAIGQQTLLLQFDEFPADAGGILIPMPPLIDITSLKYLDADGVEQTIDQQTLYLDQGQEPAWLMPEVDGEWPDTQTGAANTVRLTYRCGYTSATLPKTLQVWLMMEVGSMYENRESYSERPPSKVSFVDRMIDHLIVPVI